MSTSSYVFWNGPLLTHNATNFGRSVADVDGGADMSILLAIAFCVSLIS